MLQLSIEKQQKMNDSAADWKKNVLVRDMIFICIIEKTEGGIKNGQSKDNVKMGTRHRTKANKQTKTKITTKKQQQQKTQRNTEK